MQTIKNPHHQLTVNIGTELGWHQLFCHHLFVSFPSTSQKTPSWRLVCAPSFMPNGKQDGVNSDAVILIDFTQTRILICGTKYAGEIKKRCFQ